MAQIGEIARLTEAAGAAAAAQPAALRDRPRATDRGICSRPGPFRRTPWSRRSRCSPCAPTSARKLDRAQAHVEEARRLLASGEAVGRKIDFLAQEFNREANTLCSKSADIALTRIGLDLKAVIDQFREQR